MSNVPPPPPPPGGSRPPPPPMPPTSPPPPPPPPPYTGAGYGQTTSYAGWWRRVGAAVIDGLIGFLFAIPGLAVLLIGPSEIGTCTVNGEVGFCDIPTGATIGIAVLLYVVGAIIYLVIYCRMLGRGATWGRRALGYRILDERSMSPIGTGRAVGRYFATILSAMPCYLGFLWPLWDAEKRTFHDMIVRTRAVRN